MTIQECYAKMGADYDEVVTRLGTGKKLPDYARMFLADDNFNKLRAALAQGDVEAAFFAAHEVRGMCLNLGYDNQSPILGELIRALKKNDIETARQKFRRATRQYNITCRILKQLDEPEEEDYRIRLPDLDKW